MEKESIQIEIPSLTDKYKTEESISFIKSTFEQRLASKLNLLKVSAPIAVLDGTGINDDLNGIERPVNFAIKSMNDKKAVIIQSLAKWKRIRLRDFNMEAGKGLLTDMRALRPDEDLSPIHSIYVDQWDWEKCILPEQRNLNYLKSTVESIYEALQTTEKEIFVRYPELVPVLPEKIHFVHSEELLRQYPTLTVKQREAEVARNFGAVFIIGIGNKLSNGEPHDGRAPDYDDWSSINEEGFYGLNGDILLWNPVLKNSFEISSMGIRVNRESLVRQLEIKGCPERKNLLFHGMLLKGLLPLCIGGGIGQSRVCMFFLKKVHIGEVQSSIWPEEVINQLAVNGVKLL
jgi:aspartate--ammonia ligase